MIGVRPSPPYPGSCGWVTFHLMALAAQERLA
jgi:hypothetical protein